MSLPLYKQKEHEREPLISQQIYTGNTGLRFNKYFIHWNNAWAIAEGDKLKWIKKIGERPVGNRSLLTETTERLMMLIDFLGGKFRCYKTLWRFISGLGLNNPLENGMMWHHTLGVPYLPGTSVKGLIRAWVEQWVDDPSQREIDRIFGPRGNTQENEKANSNNDGEKIKHVGSIIFFDALPTGPVQLAADVMTPHYQNYYGGNEPPGDWLNPNPIPFLTVKENQAFLFIVAPRKINNAEQESDCKLVLKWMDQALANIGAGAKTAAGYGRFTRCNNTENQLKVAMLQRKEEKDKKMLTSIPSQLTGPIADKMIKDQYDADPEKFLRILKNKWIITLQAAETPAADQQTIAKLLKNWFQVHRQKQWKKPNKKNTPIVEAIRKVLDEEKL
jgi:CRISPR-associated protein Cmr6